jgi:hypothetical protein
MGTIFPAQQGGKRMGERVGEGGRGGVFKIRRNIKKVCSQEAEGEEAKGG